MGDTSIFRLSPIGPPPARQEKDESIFKLAPIAPPRPRVTVGSALTESVAKTTLGAGASEKYDEWIRGANAFLPHEHRQRPGYTHQLIENLARAGPEVVDFFTSPVGMALAAAHFHPVTAPVAAAADIGLGVYQGLRTIPSVIEAGRDPTNPEKMANALKDSFFTYGFGKLMRQKATGIRPLLPAERVSSRQVIERLRSAEPEEKLQILEELATPQTRRERIIGKIYETPGLRVAASMLEVPRPKLLQAAQAMVEDRINFLNVEDFKSKVLSYGIKKYVPAEERDVRRMGYVIQGSATAEEAGLSNRGRAAVERIRQFHEESDAMLRKVYGDSIPLQDAQKYLTQIWDFQGDEKRAQLAARRLMKDPFLQRRKISDYKQGIEELGLNPLMNDVTDIVVARHRAAAHAIANQHYANILRDMGALLSEQEARELGVSWNKAVDATALYRATYAGKTPRDETILMMKPVRVHPDIEMAVNAVFQNPFSFRGFGPMETLRSWSKQNAVLYSMFHHWALTEQAHAIYSSHGTLGKRALGVLKGTYLFNPDFWRGAKSGIWEVAGRPTPHDPPAMRMRPEAVVEWLQSGLELSTKDAETGFVKALREMGQRDGPLAKNLKAPFRWLGNVNYVFNRALWDYYMQGQMLHAADHIFSSEMNRTPRTTPEQITELRQAVARHVNTAFGAENLERLLVSPRGRQALNFLLFAPIWTLSNIRILTAGYQNEASTRLTNRYIAGALGTWFVTTQLANYALSGWYNTEDKNGKRGRHWSWDNPGAPIQVAGRYIPGLTENAINISAGYNPDGSQRYIRFGKGFREPFSFLISPLQTLAGKLSLPLRMLLVQATGHEPGTGFQVINVRAGLGEQAVQRAAEAADIITPFAVEDLRRNIQRWMAPGVFPETASSQFLGLPTRKGLSLSRAVDAYEQALEARRPDMARDVLTAAAKNHLNPSKVVQAYKTKQSRKRRIARGVSPRYTTEGTIVPPQSR